MNGYSNLAGVIAGQLYKSKYAPHCMSLYAAPSPNPFDCMLTNDKIAFHS
jgi:hypothetical protein